MATNLKTVSELTAQTMKRLTRSHEEWMSFLDTAAWLYKYPWHEQVMIYAQRPDARACASFDTWHLPRFRRWINKNAQGIALIDDSGARPMLKYVYDVSDTNTRFNIPFKLWEMRGEHEEQVLDELANHFGDISEYHGLPFSDRLMGIIHIAVEDNAGDYLDELVRVTNDSYLEDLDRLNIEVQFTRALETCIGYMALTRLGYDAREYFEHEDFLPVFDFNTSQTLSQLGAATGDIAVMVLREIERSVKSIERQELDTLADSIMLIDNGIEKETERSESHERDNVQQERGLSDSRYSDGRAADGADRQIRDDAENLSQGESQGNVQPSPYERQADRASIGDRQDGAGTGHADGGADGENRGFDRGTESTRPNGMGWADEQPKTFSRGGRDSGADLQLTEELPEKAESGKLPAFLSEKHIFALLQKASYIKLHQKRDIAEYFSAHSEYDERTLFVRDAFERDVFNGVLLDGDMYGYRAQADGMLMWEGNYLTRTAESLFSWSVIQELIGQLIERGEFVESYQPQFFPTVPEQISLVEQTASSNAASLAVSQQAIDEILCSAGNEENANLRICAYVQSGKTDDELAAFLKEEYGTGGFGLHASDGMIVSAWWNAGGIRIAQGKRAKTVNSTFIPWEQAAKRTRELLELGRFMSTDDLARVNENERQELAEKLWLLDNDIDGGHLLDDSLFQHGFPKDTAQLAERLQEPEQQQRFIDAVTDLAKRYAEDNRVLRYHRSDMGRIVERLDALDNEVVTFHAETPITLSDANYFITEDEIDRMLTGGGKVEGGKYRIYQYFTQSHSAAEKQAFLKEEYGIGGHSSKGYDEWHDSKGIAFSRGRIMEPYEKILLKWPQAVKRIDELIALNRYLTPEQKAYLPEYERKQAERAQQLAEERAARDTMREAERKMQDMRQNENYAFSLGDTVMIGADALTVLGYDDETVTLTDPKYPLLTQDMPRDVFERRMRENPANDHLIVREEQPDAEPETAPARTERDVFNEYSPLFISRVLFDEAHLNARSNSDEQNARTECSAAVERAMQSIIADKLDENIELYNCFFDADNGFQQRLCDYVFQKTYTDINKAVARVERMAQPRQRETVEQRNYRALGKIAPMILSGETDHVRLTAGEGLMPLSIERLSANRIAVAHNYVQNGDIMADPDMEFVIDAENKTLSARTYQQDGLGLYQTTENGAGEVVNSALMGHLNSFARTWFSNIRAQGYQLEQAGQEKSVEAETYHVGGVEYRASDMVDAISADGVSVKMVIDHVDEDYVHYTLPDLPEQQPAQMFRERFEGYLEDGSFTVSKAQQEAEPLIPVWEQEESEVKRVRIDLAPEQSRDNRVNFRITDDELGYGGAKAKYAMNIAAIHTLKAIEAEHRLATPEEQAVLSRYVGWGALANAFDESKPEWAKEYAELKELLTDSEYASARASTLNAHYTSPTVIKAIYSAVERMGFRTGNVLEPSCGVGNFFGLVPESMADCRMYGVELDPLTGRIARQLYQKNNISIEGFEDASLPDSFFDLAIGNVPFGDYKLMDRRYDKNNFLIHDYFFAKTLDKVRPGGVVAFITSSGTMDKKNSAVRKYIAQRAELLGAVRLPNSAFTANAGTKVVSDIIFLQKRDRAIEVEPEWAHLGRSAEGFPINQYFIDHPEMVLGRLTEESTQYGKQECTVAPIPGADLAEQLAGAMAHIRAEVTEYDRDELEEAAEDSIPAGPNVRNYSFAIVNGEIYYRENSRMNKQEVSLTAANRIKGMVEIRDCTHRLIDLQLGEHSEIEIRREQKELNRLYDAYTKKYGYLCSRANDMAFSDDSAYPLLCSLEVFDENGVFQRKADMFSKRTIRQKTVITSVETASEALAVSLSEKAKVDMPYMAELSGKSEEQLAEELSGLIFRDFGDLDPSAMAWAFFDPAKFPFVTADEFLSGNVRKKLEQARGIYDALHGHTNNAELLETLKAHVSALEAVQPVPLTASEIEVSLGAVWLPQEDVQDFMYELLTPSNYARSKIKVHYSHHTAKWNISSKSADRENVKANSGFGTLRANAYKIIEDTLNLRDVRIFDTVTDAHGNETRVLNKKETIIAQQKQQTIKNAFGEWIWKDPARRSRLVSLYNELFNSTRPREYDGNHLTFPGMNPAITLRPHQKNAVARALYGGNTLLGHCVGAGKTFTMAAIAMEAKRLGMCQKSIITVPSHLTGQIAAEFLQLYPSANILMTTKKDFEARNRKRFCARIATGDYDAVVIGHSQFEKIPMSVAGQKRLLEEQLNEILLGIADAKAANEERFTIKQMEKTRLTYETKLKKLNAENRKDSVVSFEELGVDKLFTDEAHNFKNRAKRCA